MTSTRTCSDCGEPLTSMFYGYEDCGPHTIEEYGQVEGYRVEPTTGFGDWGDGPTWLFFPDDRMPQRTKFYMTKDRCCGRMDLDMPDETDYCLKCRDVMEPAK